MNQPLTAMLSYQWADSAPVELLHQELALRGLSVLHDRCTFPSGSRIGNKMDDAVDICDGFVAYLTPNSLYESSAADSPRPALDAEFKPAMDRFARSNGAKGVTRRPVIIPLLHGLGDPRTEGPERVRRATGKDVSTLWTPVILDQGTPAMTSSEAASVGRSLLQALLPPGVDLETSEPIELVVTTRGEGQPPGFLTVDGTNLLGGSSGRPGQPQDWDRYLAGIRDVQATLAGWTQRRAFTLRIRAHLTAAIAFGRVFNQAAGWRATIKGRHGDVAVVDAKGHSDLRIALDKGAISTDLSVEIDLLGVNVSDLASGTLSQVHEPISNRLSIWREHTDHDLQPDEIASMAALAAAAIRDAVFDIRPARVHLFCASPVEFAVHLGHRLTSLHTDLDLYERDGHKYVRSLTIKASV